MRRCHNPVDQRCFALNLQLPALASPSVRATFASILQRGSQDHACTYGSACAPMYHGAGQVPLMTDCHADYLVDAEVPSQYGVCRRGQKRTDLLSFCKLINHDLQKSKVRRIGWARTFLLPQILQHGPKHRVDLESCGPLGEWSAEIKGNIKRAMHGSLPVQSLMFHVWWQPYGILWRSKEVAILEVDFHYATIGINQFTPWVAMTWVNRILWHLRRPEIKRLWQVLSKRNVMYARDFPGSICQIFYSNCHLINIY